MTLGAPGTNRTGKIAGTIMDRQSTNVDEDYFSLGSFSAGDVVTLDVRLPSTSLLIPRVTLVDSAGNEIADEDGDASDGHFMATLAADGAMTRSWMLLTGFIKGIVTTAIPAV